MSFGNKQYQHRFYHTPKKRIYKNNNDYTLPQISPAKQIKTSPSQYINPQDQYIHNSLVLDVFKQKAQIQKYRRKHFSVAGHYSPLDRRYTDILQPYYPYDSAIYKYELDSYNSKVNLILESKDIEIKNLYNDKKNLQKESELYQKKYKQIKRKLKEQIKKIRQKQDQENRKKYFQQQQSRFKLSLMQNQINKLSLQLQNNSKIIKEKQLQNIQLAKSKYISPYYFNQSFHQIDTSQINQNYKYMQKLKSQIKKLKQKTHNF